MDEYSGKRSANGIIFPRKGGGGLVLRDTVNNREQNAQFCNKIGCSSRTNSMKVSQIGCSEKAKSSRPSFRASSSGKEIIGSSSRTFPAKPYAKSRKNLSPPLETDSSETSSIQDEPEIVTEPGKIQKGLPSEYTTFREETSTIGSSSSKSRKNLNHRNALSNQDNNLGASSVLLASRSSIQTTTRANAGKNSLRNLKSNSTSDDIPSGSDSSQNNKRKNIIKKRNPEGESSSSSGKGKKMSASSFEDRYHGSNPGISISDSRRTRNWNSNRDSNGVVSVRTQRSTNNYGRTRLSILGNGNNLPSNESVAPILQMPQPDMSLDLNSPQFSAESSSGRLNFFSPQGNSNEGLLSFLPGSPSQAGITHSLVNLDSFRRYNMDGIAEVLSALERIEQDEELTYEELLALEDRMGTVSTALTEEALLKCLNTSIFQSIPLEDLAITGHARNKDDAKCSICQEDYVDGEEVGKLHCDHKYHVFCVSQWLQLKNWCPICKSPAEVISPPRSSPLSS
ncbi:hypothetical protein ACFE04_001303 [Oxalis oulophora]